jgi:hypothetical protein
MSTALLMDGASIVGRWAEVYKPSRVRYILGVAVAVTSRFGPPDHGPPDHCCVEAAAGPSRTCRANTQPLRSRGGECVARMRSWKRLRRVQSRDGVAESDRSRIRCPRCE